MSVLDGLKRRAALRREGEQLTVAQQERVSELSRRFRAHSKPPDPIEHVPGLLAVRLLNEKAAANPAGWSDIKRIVNLPVRYDLEPEEVEEFCRENLLASAYEKGFRLWPKQCEAVMQYDALGGVFGPIGVGWGKTLISLMIAARAYKKTHCRNGRKNTQRVLLITTPSVYEQLVDHDIPWARTKVPLNAPFYPLGGKGIETRRAFAKARRKGIYIIPNSLLSARDASEFLAALQPDCIILDEAHNCANSSAARTKRLFALRAGAGGYITEFDPEFIALSGTMTKKSIRDYHHLLKAALGEGMPLPLSTQLASEWASVLDADAGEPSAGATGPIKPMVEWARKRFPHVTFGFDTAGIRAAYRHRLTASPGVVATGDADIGVSLVIANEQVKYGEDTPGWPELKVLIDQVNDAWLTPNLDEIDHAIHCYKWLYELSAGFYNQLTWPTAEVYAQRKEITESEAQSILDRAQDHHEAQQEYAKALRSWLADYGKAGCDTPMLVANSMHQHGAKFVTPMLYEAWQRMKSLEFDGMPSRDAKAIRVCDYKIRAAVKWAESVPAKSGAIFWVHHQEVGRWLYEYLYEKFGTRALHCPAGAEHNTAILDPKNADKLIVASIKAHGVGKNLQAFQHQRIVQWPRSPVDAEQMLGRTHRNGQHADELIVSTCNTLNFDATNFAACVNDALYIHTTTDNRQKLIYCAYKPLPTIFPSEVLRERGMQNHILSREQRKILDEKFANSDPA